MTDDPPLRQVEVRFASAPPAAQVARAPGVSAVEASGLTLRCLICGSFQPFLEALRGHEVLALTSIPVLDEHQSPALTVHSGTPDHEACHGS
jgi:hypothetical protein